MASQVRFHPDDEEDAQLAPPSQQHQSQQQPHWMRSPASSTWANQHSAVAAAAASVPPFHVGSDGLKDEEAVPVGSPTPASKSLPEAEAAALASTAHPFVCGDLVRADWWGCRVREWLALVPTISAWCWQVLAWALLMVPMGCLVGVFSALFLASVDGATHARFDAPWLLYLLPLSGALQALVYRRWARVPVGQRAFGVDFIIEQVHNPDARKGRASVPARMGWLAWAGTAASHLCGASVGREGTGLQLAASLADSYSWLLRHGSRGFIVLSRAQCRTLTVASMAAGFSGVFGTPFAGTLFALEVLEAGSGLATDNVVPAMMASASANIVSDAVLRALGKHHTAYPLFPEADSEDHLEVKMIFLLAAAALFFGLIARVFSWAIHALQAAFRALFASQASTANYGWFFTPILGGGLVIALVGVFQGDRTYLGIGTLRPNDDPGMTILPSCFASDDVCTDGAWAGKMLFTVVSLASGYKGGEVTCLFFVGAAAGWAVAQWFAVQSATHLFASSGFVAVFGAASNTPLASTIMAVELFGARGARVVYVAMACAISYVVSGQHGIYSAQRPGGDKLARHSPPALINDADVEEEEARAEGNDDEEKQQRRTLQGSNRREDKPTHSTAAAAAANSSQPPSPQQQMLQQQQQNQI